MAKVLIRYGTHPREKGGKWTTFFMRPKYMKDPNVKFQKVPFKQTSFYDKKALIKKIKSELPTMNRLEKREKIWGIIDKEEKERKERNKKAKKEGYIPIDLHTWGGKEFIVFYSPKLNDVANKLKAYLAKKGWGEISFIPQFVHGKEFSIELPGRKKNIIPKKIKLLYKDADLYVPLLYHQTVTQLKQSKQFVTDMIEFLKQYKN